VNVLETNVVVYLPADRVAEVPPDGLCAISAMSEKGLRCLGFASDTDRAAKDEILAVMTVIDLTPAIRVAAVSLRRAHRLRRPDAITAATALVHDATLLTNDQRLARTPGLKARPLALKP